MRSTSRAKNINMAFMNAGTDPAPYLNDYRNAVRYTDTMVGRVLTSCGP
ncbi:MAG: hypothetical protein IPI34_09490 [bacterium]|nr:hypothetical protein [bacterium]